MQKAILIALGAAFCTGIGMGVLGAINGQAGRLIGPLATGLVVNFLGGLTAVIVLILIRQRLVALDIYTARTALPFLVLSGGLGIATLTGISFSVGRIGTAAGLAAIITGQMITAAALDTLGIGTPDAIRLDSGRVIGLLLMGVATWLLLPAATQP